MGVVVAASSGTGATVGISGYSNLAPSSHLKTGQQPGNGAVLLVFSSSNLHLGLASGSGPQSSTNSKRRGGLSSETTQVERPQKGCNSQVLPGSTVAHLVLAKHIPGKSKKTINVTQISTKNYLNTTKPTFNTTVLALTELLQAKRKNDHQKLMIHDLHFAILSGALMDVMGEARSRLKWRKK